MKLFCVLAAGLIDAKRPLVRKTADTLTTEQLALLDPVTAAQERMSEMYLTKAENYGKKDWSVNADGVKRWVEKLKPAWEKQVAKCKTGYAEDAPATWSASTYDIKGKNRLCIEFNQHVDTLVTWTNTFMPVCSYDKVKYTSKKVCKNAVPEKLKKDKDCIKERKNNPELGSPKDCPLVPKQACEKVTEEASRETNLMEGQKKFVKKWKKIMIAFHGAMKNHPSKGALCDENWEPSYT